MGDQTLTNRVVVVTGAASGIGLAIAERFAAAGGKVVISDINAEAGLVAAERVGGLFVQGDLSQRADCRALIEQTVEAYGAIDVLVNNAGFQHVSPVEEFPEDIWDKLIALMLTAPFLLTRYAWPHMKNGQWGRIINIASIHGVVASPFKAAYISAKHGLIGLTRTTAIEGGPHGITVNAICPAYVRTPLVENQIADQARSHGISTEEVIRKIMLEPAAIKRMIEPEEVAELAHFLCREEASVMSGSPIMVDLAWTAR